MSRNLDDWPYVYVGTGYWRDKRVAKGKTAPILHGGQAIRAATLWVAGRCPRCGSDDDEPPGRIPFSTTRAQCDLCPQHPLTAFEDQEFMEHEAVSVRRWDWVNARMAWEIGQSYNGEDA